jgi:DNA polymerase-1
LDGESILRVVADIETNALENPTQVWCLCAIDIDTKKEYSFDLTKDTRDFLSWASGVTSWVGHNFIAYDAVWLKQLVGLDIQRGSVVDTLVLSHLLKYKLDDGHSLEAWGDRLKIKKVGLDVDFSTPSSAIIERCKTDVKINLALYEYLMSKLDRKEFHEAIRTEMEFAWVCRDMHEAGFAFDIDGAKELYNEIDREVQELDRSILAAFPPKAKLIREITPKLTKHGTISRSNMPRDWVDFTIVSDGAPFSLVDFEPFNPTSTKQIIERLAPFWDPVDRTDGYIRAQKERDKAKMDKLHNTAWKVNEVNLSTLSQEAPDAAKFLVRRLMLGARLRTLTEWMQSYNPSTGRVHGRFSGIGTWTHRMAHKEPNLGNVAAEKSIKYNSPELKKEATRIGGRMRALWQASKDSWLVGTDMESAHLRIFAHLIDDDNFRNALLTGDKKLGTDPHSTNARLLGSVCPDRDRAKTFIFTFLNGGGAAKVASIFGTSTSKAKESISRFIEGYKGLAAFKEKDAEAWARRGYFIGPDGRFVVCDSAHHMLAGYLQNYEATMMKKANLIWRAKADELGIKYKQVNLVHDEYVTEVTDTYENAVLLGSLQRDAIRDVGQLYGIRCPMAGESKIGKNWLEVH